MSVRTWALAYLAVATVTAFPAHAGIGRPAACPRPARQAALFLRKSSRFHTG